MSVKIRKIFSFVLSIALFSQQIGFGQLIQPPTVYPIQYQVLDRFRPIHLRYLSYEPQVENIKFVLDKGDVKEISQRAIDEASRQLLNYFQIGLALPNSAFWVNLRPDSPDQIIDENLAMTDIGKVLLEADLQLKKDLARFTAPNTPTGKEYWNKLYAKVDQLFGEHEDLSLPTYTRPWIVPGEIIIATDTKGAYIYKATLKVMLEQDYLKDAEKPQFNDSRQKVLNDYSSQLIREIILPCLTKEVNSSRKYASLRQVYYSLILAQWFKTEVKRQNSLFSGGSLISRIDSGNLSGLTSKDTWSKMAYFNAYRQSFEKGEYNLEEEVQTSHGVTIRQYFSGGANFSKMELTGFEPNTSGDVFLNNNGSLLDDIIKSTFNYTGELRLNPNTKLDGGNEQEKARELLNKLVGPKKVDVAEVPPGAAINGSFAVDEEGNQGYFTNTGKNKFFQDVKKLEGFFKSRESRLKKPIKLIIKIGIGGQHTPFQAIASILEPAIEEKNAKILGVYELGVNYEKELQGLIDELGIDWDQVAVVVSSKSGSTDETMLIYAQILFVLLKKIAPQVIAEIDGQRFAEIVFETLHELNFENGQEKETAELFKVSQGSLINLITQKVNSKLQGKEISSKQVKDVLALVLDNMIFETTNNPSQSRLAAFIHNSGLKEELKEDAPLFIEMFDNVGGRWTIDLHMMLFLAFMGLDTQRYWEKRNEEVRKVRENKHQGIELGNKILDEQIEDIVLVVPKEFYWLAKALEQNFNESIWQEGAPTLIAVKAEHWQNNQENYYKNRREALVINLSNLDIDDRDFNLISLTPLGLSTTDKNKLLEDIAHLVTSFYAMTNTVGTRLIVRALEKEGYSVEDVDMNDPENPATKIVLDNLFLLQPMVELGKKLLEEKLAGLQKKKQEDPKAIEKFVKQIAEKVGSISSNLDLKTKRIENEKDVEVLLKEIINVANQEKRRVVPILYYSGSQFTQLRDYLVEIGFEWVLQGTGDQHINLQQILSLPENSIPLIVSFVPEEIPEGLPAIGFAKGYLDKVPAEIVRDQFAEATYRVLTGLKNGKAAFLRLSENQIEMFRKGAQESAIQLTRSSRYYGGEKLALIQKILDKNQKLKKALEEGDIKTVEEIINNLNLFNKMDVKKLRLASEEEIFNLKKFLGNKDLSKKFLEKAKEFLLGGKKAHIILAGGAATRLQADMEVLLGRKLQPEEFRMYTLALLKKVKEIQDNIEEVKARVNKLTDEAKKKEWLRILEEIEQLDITKLGELIELPLGSLQLLALRKSLGDLAKENNKDIEEVLKNQWVIIVINEDIEKYVIEDLIKNKFYGFDPNKVLLINQPVYEGITVNAEGEAKFLVGSVKYPYGHLDNARQLIIPRTAFTVSDSDIETKSGKIKFSKKYILQTPLDHLEKNGVQTIGNQRINDLTQIDPAYKDNETKKLALALYLFKKYNMVVELVDNPGGQKGGNAVVYEGKDEKGNKFKKGFLLETLETEGNQPEGKILRDLLEKAGEEEAPYNAFRILYSLDELKKILKEEQKEPLIFLRYRVGENGKVVLSSDDPTGALTQLAKKAAFVTAGEEIQDFKEFKNLPKALTWLENSLKGLKDSLPDQTNDDRIVYETISERKIKLLLEKIGALDQTKFGTSGVRGYAQKTIGEILKEILGENEEIVEKLKDKRLLEDIIFPIVITAIAKNGEEKGHKKYILGGDTRINNKENIKMAIKILAAFGIRAIVVVDKNGKPVPVPTPVLALLTRKFNADGCIIFTASHNPGEDNGVKFSEWHGGAASKETTDGIQKYINEMLNQPNLVVQSLSEEETKKQGLFTEIKEEDVVKLYLDFLFKNIDIDKIISFLKENPQFKIVLSPMQGAAGRVMQKIAEILNTAVGKEVVEVINTSQDPYFKEVNGAPNPTEEENIKKIIDKYKDENTLVLLVDGDGDRSGIIENGKVITANELLALMADWIIRTKRKEKSELHIGKTVATSNFVNAVVDYWKEMVKVVLHEVKVGFKWFVKKVIEDSVNFVIAGEESAHTMLSSETWDDGILFCLAVLAMLSDEKKTLSEMKRELEERIGKKFYYERYTVNFDKLATSTVEAVEMKSKVQQLIDNIKDEVKEAEKQNKPITNTKIAELLKSYGIKYEIKEIITKDGVKIVFETGDWMLIRLSGTENAARLYIEVTDLKSLEVFKKAGYKLLGVEKTDFPEDSNKRDGGNEDWEEEDVTRKQPQKFGGIDFRSLPLWQQVIATKPLSELAVTRIQINKNVEPSVIWSELEQNINMGKPLPINRLKEYLASCCQKGKVSEERNRMLVSIATLLRYEEEEVLPTSPEIKELLVFLNSTS